MKTLITLFVLLCSSSVVAENISDFQIEGISVGDSALDYYTKDEINDAQRTNFPNSDEFYQIAIFDLSSSKLEVYDGITFYLKKNDNNYKIYGLRGGIFFHDNYEKCLLKKNEVEKDISFVFKYIERIDHGTFKHFYDKSGKSKLSQVEFFLESSNDSIIITCYDWSKKITEELKWKDNLSVEAYSKEFADWLREQY